MKKIFYSLFVLLALGYSAQAQSSLLFTEFSYDSPESGTDSLEFIEIYNNSNTSIDVSGYKLLFGSTPAERFVFPANTSLSANQVVVIAVNAGALQRQFNMATLPYEWTGTNGLGNSGSKLILRDAANVTLDSVSYTSGNAPTGTNGNGKTAVLCDLSSDNNQMSNWSASTMAILNTDGTPRLINGKALYGSPGYLECGVTTPIAPPANDDCSGAIALVVDDAPISGNLLNATEWQSFGCSSFTFYDVWYSFTASRTGTYEVEVTTDIDLDVVLEVFSGNCNNLLSVNCDDSMVRGSEYITVNATAGQTYYIRVYEYDGEGTNPAEFTVSVESRNIPSPGGVANDECIGAIELTMSSSCTSYTATLQGATESLSPCDYWSDQANDVWFRFTATSTGAIITIDNTDMDVIYQLYSGSTCNNLSDIICVDMIVEPGEQSSHSNLIIGETYYIRVYEYDDSPLFGNFDICITSGNTPTNDDCINAIPLTPNTNCNPTSGSLFMATHSMDANDCEAFDLTIHDVWYSFVAVAPTATVNVQGWLAVDAIVEVLSGSCSNLTPVDCVDDTAPMLSYGLIDEMEELYLTNLTIGQTYYIRVYDYDFENISTEFDICVISTPVDPCTNVTITTTIEGCDADATSLVLGGTSPYTYAWSNGNTTASATGLVVGTTYTLTVTDANGCIGTATYTAAACTVVDPCANVTISYDLRACDLSAEFITIAGGTTPYTFQWSTGETTESITNLTIGETYSVTITDANGCSVSETFEQTTCPAVNQVAAGFNMNVYPNPAQTIATLAVETMQTIDLRIELVNVMGQVMYSQEVTQTAAMQYELPIANFTSGVYFIKVSSKEGVATMRLIIAK